MAAGPAATTAAEASVRPRATEPRRAWKDFTAEEKTAYFEERKRRSEEAIVRAEQGMQDMLDHPEVYEMWMRSLQMRKTYSINNYVLMHLQRPGITDVRSMSEWRKAGRIIAKGERGLVALGPDRSEVSEWEDVLDASGAQIINPKTGKPRRRKVLDADGEPVTKVINRGFKADARRCDIGQTIVVDEERAAADAQATRGGRGRSDAGSDLIADLTRVAGKEGITVIRGAVDDADSPHRDSINLHLLTNPNAGGFYMEREDVATGARSRYIVTRAGDDHGEARVIAHELAHGLLHSKEAIAALGEDARPDTRQRELEAEATGYALCAAYGVEDDTAAFGYLRNWGRDESGLKRLKASSERIRQTVGAVLSAVDAP